MSPSLRTISSIIHSLEEKSTFPDPKEYPPIPPPIYSPKPYSYSPPFPKLRFDLIYQEPSPEYVNKPNLNPNLPSSKGYQVNLGLAVESMSRHTTDEGWQIFDGLSSSGYILAGDNLEINQTHIPDILNEAECYAILGVRTLILQDKREWDVSANSGDFRDKCARFTGVEYLKDRNDIFKLTILKDAHHRPTYHETSAREVDCHAWVIYYNASLMLRFAPYLRPQHLVRTYHSVNADDVPPYLLLSQSPRLNQALFSGAISSVYPLRRRIKDSLTTKPLCSLVSYLKHPGYSLGKCYTPDFLQTLSAYKVAICTSSTYGYALRKIIEATACGCRVITDLPVDEVMPEIDGNLVRISPDISMSHLGDLISHLCSHYDQELQEYYCRRCLQYYNHRSLCSKLARDIENLRLSYNIQPSVSN